MSKFASIFFLLLISPVITWADVNTSLNSPESTLALYLKCFETADVDCVLRTYHGIDNFSIMKPFRTSYEIRNKIVYGENEVKKWNSRGTTPRAEIGDVQLEVWQKINSREAMYTYNLRKIDGKWYMISHYSWDAP